MNLLAQTLENALWVPRAEHLAWLAPELALVATIVLILVAPLIFRRSSYTTAGIVLAGAVVTTLLAYRVTLPLVQLRGMGGVTPDESPMLVVDNLSIFFKLFLMLFLVLVTGLWLIGSAEREKDAPEFFVLLVGSALGMSLMVSTLNLLLMVIAIELASLPSYAMAGFNKRSRVGAEASLKYVIFGAACAAIMIYGVSLLYGLYGTLDVRVIAQAMHAAEKPSVLAGVAWAAVLVGVGFKISAVPFHFWCPDVFEGAKIEVTTWLSVASKAAGLGLLLRLIYAFTSPVGSIDVENATIVPMLAWGIGIVAAITCTVGNLAAYQQTSVKRMLAYSSIAHAGYMLMACAVLLAPAAGPHRAISAVVAYLLVYLFMNLGAFGTVALVLWATGKETIDAYSGLWRRAPWLAIPMAVCLFSLIGLPPMGGFIAKFYLLQALFEGGTALEVTKPLLYGLVIVAVANTLLSLFYYLRVVRAMFFTDDEQPAIEVPLSGLAIVNACAVVLLLTGTVFADHLRRSADRYAQNLYDDLPPAAVQTAASDVDAAPPVLPLGDDPRSAATDPTL